MTLRAAYKKVALGLAGLAFAVTALGAQSQSQEEKSLNELRNTVVNLLQALVDRGVLTREQAQAMVKSAEEKAAADAAAAAQRQEQQEKEEAGAVRVPYVPQIVKEEIRKEVVQDLAPSVREDVKREVTRPDSLVSVLPEWVRRMRWTGDVRFLDEGDVFPSGNVQNFYLDLNQVNAKGGIQKAGESAILNTTEDRNRLRLRLRFGFDADLGAGFTMGVRAATGTGEIFPSTNQTLGTYGSKYQLSLDQGYLGWANNSFGTRQVIALKLGRFENPYLATDLVWYPDLTFEGITGNYRFNLGTQPDHRRDLFLTVGAYPLNNLSPLDSNPVEETKWLAAAQLGVDWHTDAGSRLALTGAYYDYIRNVGILNPPQGTAGNGLDNWTAPGFFQKGNTVFNIANSTDPTVQLFALAADFRVADVLLIGTLHLWSNYQVGLTAEALQNVGYDTAAVSARFGSHVAPRNRGWRADLLFGSDALDAFGRWQATAGYRYLERDAVLDAFNDEDFHLGGTDAKGYTLRFDYAFNPRVFLRLKYMQADAIDGPPLAIDVWQVAFNARF